VQLAMALIAVALAVKYAHHSWRYPPSGHLDVPDTVTAHATPLLDLKAGRGKAPTPATKTPEEEAKNDIAIKPVSMSGIDESVVDQPFQISASIREGCKGDTIECQLVMTSVARLVKEPRDIDWAAKVEEKIQAAVDTQGPGRYVIRNLECRTSTCVLEVEVHVPGAFNGRYDDSLFSSLRPNAMTISVPEYDASGTRFHVELMDFARR
jgi:hypothetical protein